MSVMADHIAAVRHAAADAERARPSYRAAVATAPAVQLRTQFCTATGWHRYDAISPAMRRALLATDGVEGDCVPGWVTTRTAGRLVAMALLVRAGFTYRLTYHGAVLWLEIDA